MARVPLVRHPCSRPSMSWLTTYYILTRIFGLEETTVPQLEVPNKQDFSALAKLCQLKFIVYTTLCSNERVIGNGSLNLKPRSCRKIKTEPKPLSSNFTTRQDENFKP
ncbi:hypothetical protein TNCV_2724561 [Trichonephila clavipes]|nr:hypothetical protein TNCV_2724561 [Trichonephila clavipes]